MLEPESDQEQVIRQVYPQLREMARRLLRHERVDHTLQPTALAHEAFVKLFGEGMDPAVAPAKFLSYAAHQMRRILIDYSRKHGAKKRGGDAVKIPISGTEPDGTPNIDGLLEIDAVLDKLGEVDPRGLQVVELKFFAGFTNEETAAILGVSSTAVDAAWHHARLWLFRELSRGPNGKSQRAPGLY